MKPSESYLTTPTDTAVPLQELRDVCSLRSDTSWDTQLTELCDAYEKYIADCLNRPVRVGTNNDVFESFSEELELSETPNANLIIAWYDENHSESVSTIRLLGTEPQSTDDWAYDTTGNKLVWTGDNFPELSDRFEYPVRVSYGYGGLISDPRVETAIRSLVLVGFSHRSNLPIDAEAVKYQVMCMLEPLKKLIV